VSDRELEAAELQALPLADLYALLNEQLDKGFRAAVEEALRLPVAQELIRRDAATMVAVEKALLERLGFDEDDDG
jgi:hypothetical protein